MRYSKGWGAVLIIILLLLLDQALKIWIKTHMQLHESIEITPWFYLYFTENPGMAFGIEVIGKLFLSVFRIVAVLFIGYYLYKLVKENYKFGFIACISLVFAESEVVSLVAQNKNVADIIHGLNVSVASKVGALAARLGKNNPGEYMMTGGVAKNKGITNALEEKLGAKLYICDEAQLCGALGAALFAYEKCKQGE